MVSCEAFDQNSNFTSSPVLIVEVLSRSTAAIDRREKMLAYKQIESLNEYLIVHQTKQRVEIHRKNELGNWDVFEFGEGATIELGSIPVGGLKVSIASIYEDVDWKHDNNNWTVREIVENTWPDDELVDW